MKKLIIVGIMFLVLPFYTFAQGATSTSVNVTGTVTLKDAGLLPGDFFYFFDKLGESINIAFTFNKENKARKHIEYAKERVAEINEVLKNEKAVVGDIADAKKDFEERIAEVAVILQDGGMEATEASKLALEIDDELDSSKEALREIFKHHKNRSSNAEEKLITLMASLPKGDPQLAGLSKALESITKEKDDSIKIEDDLDIDFVDEKDIFENIMGKQISSQKHTDEATELMTSLGGLIPGGAVISAKALLKKADDANTRGDFDLAKKLSKQAKDILEKASDVLEENEDENEIDDELDIDGSLDDSSIRNLEQEIEKGDRMLDGLR